VRVASTLVVGDAGGCSVNTGQGLCEAEPEGDAVQSRANFAHLEGASTVCYLPSARLRMVHFTPQTAQCYPQAIFNTVLDITMRFLLGGRPKGLASHLQERIAGANAQSLLQLARRCLGEDYVPRPTLVQLQDASRFMKEFQKPEATELGINCTAQIAQMIVDLLGEPLCDDADGTPLQVHPHPGAARQRFEGLLACHPTLSLVPCYDVTAARLMMRPELLEGFLAGDAAAMEYLQEWQGNKTSNDMLESSGMASLEPKRSAAATTLAFLVGISLMRLAYLRLQQ